jgi:UDP-N-acetylmuramoyl-tripeptide--D-alanyl-D-alanine ligase
MIMDIESLYKVFRGSAGITTDSRSVAQGQVFFALKGESFDGNAYALQALEKGAVCAVVNADSEAAASGDARVVAVEDTLAALKALAAWHRRHVREDLIVLGLTGTNGKTTTKELIRSVLSLKYNVLATEGNLNNDIGVPLTVLKLRPEHEIAVIEMGASHPEDITALTPVSQPDYGLITNVGKAHLLGFGSFEGVKRAKGRLYDWIRDHGKAVFVNGDDPDLTEMASARGLKEIPYGFAQDGAEILPSSAEVPFVRIRVGETLVRSNLVGVYNATNILAAMAVGRYFGIPTGRAAEAIAAYHPTNNRSQLSRTARNTLIEDAYNANPSSMAAALDNFANMADERKVALLGDMRELGEDSVTEHINVLRRLEGLGLYKVCLVGEEFRKALDDTGLNFSWFPSSDELAASLAEHPLEGCVILVKGSRGIRMEKVIPAL